MNNLKSAYETYPQEARAMYNNFSNNRSFGDNNLPSFLLKTAGIGFGILGLRRGFKGVPDFITGKGFSATLQVGAYLVTGHDTAIMGKNVKTLPKQGWLDGKRSYNETLTHSFKDTIAFNKAFEGYKKFTMK